MARIYIANPTNQAKQVNYRLDYTVDEHGNRTSQRLLPYKSETIPAGRQLPVGGDLHISQIEEIVKQLSQYGLVAMLEIKTAKARGKVALIFNLDKPVSMAIMKDAQDHNMGVLDAEGFERRRLAAIASSEALAGTVSGQGIPDVKDPKKFEVEYEQVNEDENYPDANLADGLKVVRAHGKSPEPKRRHTPKRKAA